MKRILIAGFQHETNTFGATRATLADFEMADSWPGLLCGAEVIDGTKGANLPIAGFVREAQGDPSLQLVPVIWGSAEPSSYVTDDAYEHITSQILGAARTTAGLDGVYLDLHGAMVTESHEDGEGELLRRLREVVGPDLPISVSLDLHANVTKTMVDLASSITIFRTYPHLDMAGTGGRAYHALRHLMAGGRLHGAHRQVPFLIPLHAQYTEAEPLRSVYAQVAAVGPAPKRWAEFAAGFTAADIYDAGPSVLAYGRDQVEADAIADRLMAEVMRTEPLFDCALLEPSEAVASAIAMTPSARGPVILADVQDNPGAGGTSDTTGLLRALVSGGAKGAVLGMLCDPVVAEAAHMYGTGASFSADLGGKAGPDPAPFSGRFSVEALSDGKFSFGGQMYAGIVAETGPTVLLRVLDRECDVRVVVSSRRCQCLDQAIFAHIGVPPLSQEIIAVKSTVHFRADFEPIAEAVMNVAAPGLFACRTDEIPYRKLRAGIRRAPRGITNTGAD